jgi:prevent-host-death family protein
MRTITATELRMKLGAILDAASAGERILVERDHKPLIYLVSVEEVERQMATERQARIDQELAALDRLVEFGKEMRAKYPDPEDGLTYVEWRRQEYERRDERISRAAAGLPPLDDESVPRR